MYSPFAAENRLRNSLDPAFWGYGGVSGASKKLYSRPVTGGNYQVVVFAIAVVVVVAAFVAVLVFVRSVYRVPVPNSASRADRVSKREQLETAAEGLTSENADAVAFLFDEVKAAFASARQGIQGLDTKAGTLIGLVTGGLGAIAFLGDSSKVPAKTPCLYAGLALLGLALFSALLAVPSPSIRVPDLSQYALQSTLGDNDNKARIQFDLIGDWLRSIRESESIAIGKSRLLLAAVSTTVAGVLFLTLNYAWGTAHPTKPDIQTIQIIQVPTPTHR